VEKKEAAMNTKKRMILLAVVMLVAALACRLPLAGAGERRADTPREVPAGSGSTAVVTAREFSLDFEPARPAPGEVTFVVINEGHTAHDFQIRGSGVNAKTEMIDPGEQATLTVYLEPGSYDYECTVLGHAMLGMSGTFQVGEVSAR